MRISSVILRCAISFVAAATLVLMSLQGAHAASTAARPADRASASSSVLAAKIKPLAVKETQPAIREGWVLEGYYASGAECDDDGEILVLAGMASAWYCEELSCGSWALWIDTLFGAPIKASVADRPASTCPI